MEKTKFNFYVIACYSKKDRPFKGDKKGKFAGYWSGPFISNQLESITNCWHYETRAAAREECRELNKDDSYFFYGRVKKYSATLEGK